MIENQHTNSLQKKSKDNLSYLAFTAKAQLHTSQNIEISSINSDRKERKRKMPMNTIPEKSKSLDSICSFQKFFNATSENKNKNFEINSPRSNKSSTSQRIANDINTLLNENFPSDQEQSLGKFSIFVNKNQSPQEENQHKSSFYKLSEKKKENIQKKMEEQKSQCNTKSKTFTQLNKTAHYNNDFLKYVMKKTLFSQQQEAQLEKDQFEKQEQYFQLDFAQPERETQISSENQSQRYCSSSTIEFQNYCKNKFQEETLQNHQQNYYQQQLQKVPSSALYHKFQIQQQFASANSIGGPPSLFNLSEFEEPFDQTQQMSSSQFNQILQNYQQNQTPPYMNAIQLAQDQQGCRLLQKYLEKNDSIILNILFDQLIQIIPQLIIDQYGNYLCQKLAEVCNHQQFLSILQVIKPTIISISLHPLGTRVIQKIIDIFSNQYSPYKQQIISVKAGTKIQVLQVIENVNFLPQQEISYYLLMVKELTEGLGQDIYSLASDQNGNHVLQKCFVLLSFVEKQFIFDGVMMDCARIAAHKFGCCVLQRCIDYGNVAQKEKLILVIILNLPLLIFDQFANFVIGYILDLQGFQEYKQQIANYLITNIISFSKQKFPSNIIEKCIALNLSNFRNNVIECILNSQCIGELLIDRYANYVVQRCLYCANPNQLMILLKEIAIQQEIVKQTDLGIKLLGKINRQYPVYQQICADPNNYYGKVFVKFQNAQNTKQLSLQNLDQYYQQKNTLSQKKYPNLLQNNYFYN